MGKSRARCDRLLFWALGASVVRLIFLVLGSLWWSCSVGGNPLPDDVVKFIERRDLCDHFRGEEPYDSERAEFLANAIRRDCTGTDTALAALMAKYQNDSEILAELSTYEPNIEM